MGMRVIYNLDVGDLSRAAEQARWAESMGYDGVTSNETAHDPFFPLLLAAGATSRVSLSTHVAIAFPRSPMVVAYAARDLHDHSGGRFVLGLGTQVKGHNERRFSVGWDSPGPRLREYVQALHAIWDNWQHGTKLDFQGRFYTFTLMTPFFSPGAGPFGRPEVYTGGVNAYNCRVAGEVCDGLVLHTLCSLTYLKEVIMPAVARGARVAEREPKEIKLSGGSFVITGPNRAAVEAERQKVKRRIAFYASTRTYFPVLEIHGFHEIGQRLHEMSLKGRWDEMSSLVNDEMLDAYAVSGGYDEVALQLKERFGGVLDEISFQMDTSPPGAEAELKKILEVLKS